MAAAQPPSFFDKLQQALGLSGRRVERMVIVADVGEPVQVFIKEMMDPSNMAQAAEALQEFRESLAVETVADVAVDANGNVFVEVNPNGP